MAYDNKNYDEKRTIESVYSKRIKAGKRRTYFFDVRETRSNDYFITITESKKKFNDDGYDRHKVFIYKEDFNKFLDALTETVNHVKTDLMPDFDFDAFNHEYDEEGENNYNPDSYRSTTENTSEEKTDTSFNNNISNNDIAPEGNNDNTSIDEWKM